MGEDKTEQKGNLNNDQRMAVENMHKTFLEALRHREQEILKYIAFLAPALAGFIWLLKVDLRSGNGPFIFTAGTLGVLFLLTVGVLYSLALGYNFRYVTLQLAKMESDYCLNIKEFILESWLRTAKQWEDKYEKGKCLPPEIINIFFWSFIIATFLIAIMAILFLFATHENLYVQICIILGWLALCIIFVFRGLRHYSRKFRDYCKKEVEGGKW